MSVAISTASRAETVRLGAEVGRRLLAGDVLLLHGDVGSGKTTLAQGILAGLAVEGPAPSPTFTLVHEYQGEAWGGEPLPIYHLDLYRLSGEEDLDSFGFDDFLAPVDGVSLIEWPERAASRLDGPYLLVDIIPTGEQRRQFHLSKAPPDTPRFPWLADFTYGQCDPNSR